MQLVFFIGRVNNVRSINSVSMRTVRSWIQQRTEVKISIGPKVNLAVALLKCPNNRNLHLILLKSSVPACLPT